MEKLITWTSSKRKVFAPRGTAEKDNTATGWEKISANHI
jgi:hypothetical protein